VRVLTLAADSALVLVWAQAQGPLVWLSPCLACASCCLALALVAAAAQGTRAAAQAVDLLPWVGSSWPGVMSWLAVASWAAGNLVGIEAGLDTQAM